jgi:hypothetical protein
MLIYVPNHTQYNISRGKQTPTTLDPLVLIYFLLSYLSWKKRNTQKKKKKKPNKQPFVLKESTVSTYKIKVRNKQQGTQACRRQKIFVNEKRDKQKATKR